MYKKHIARAWSFGKMAHITGFTRAVAAALWPVSHIAIAASIDSDQVSKYKAGKLAPADERYRGKPVADTVMDHLGVQLAGTIKLIAAIVSFYYFFPKDISIFTVLDWNNKDLQSAVRTIFLRDLFLTWVAAGFWDFMVYFSPLAEKFDMNKFNPEPAKTSQRLHDMFWTHVSTAVSTLWEVLALHWMASGTVTAHVPPVWWKDTATVAWLLSMPYWRLAHFYFLHRSMHPWRRTVFGVDPGLVIYRWVHSLHHKSKNPISWSGISMHPVESAGYYTAMWVPVLAGPVLARALTWAGFSPAAGSIAFLAAHPIVMLFTKFDLTMAALIGHDGFGFPGGGSQAHWLHHNNFECNYGENYAPFDYWFGTFAADEADFQAKFGDLNLNGNAKKGKATGSDSEDPVGEGMAKRTRSKKTA